MSNTDLNYLFTSILPFRGILLSILAPFEISNLLEALQCDLSPWEKGRFLDVLDDIFEDSRVIYSMAKLGMTIRIFGADLQTLQARLCKPSAYFASSAYGRSLHIFVLVVDHRCGSDQLSTLVRDYRPEADQGKVPIDMGLEQLRDAFDAPIAEEIANLSQWILCAPYLSGTLPGKPGWIPVFNSRPRINVRAYISAFNNWDERILHMDRISMRRAFGYDDNFNFISNLSSLSTLCLKLEGAQRSIQSLPGKLTMNALHDVYATSDKEQGEDEKFVVVNTIHTSNSSIILTLV
jgi:hypothetical protein